MSAEHKEALARGRDEGRAVRRYLEAIEEQRPRPGRQRTPESITRRLDAVNEKLSGADALARLHLLQEHADLEAELGRAGAGDDLADLEARFLKVAKSYGDARASATAPGAPPGSTPMSSSAPASGAAGPRKPDAEDVTQKT